MPSLQCVRALAALLVVYFHAALQLHKFSITAAEIPAWNFPVFGKSGVDIFFVLSGLLIWRSTRGDGEAPHIFYAKRFIRIAPLYWIVTLAAALIALALPSALRSTRFDFSHVLASLAFIPWPNPAAIGNSQVVMTPVIVPGWTLNFEMLFYSLFGLCLLIPQTFRFGMSIALFCAVASASLAWKNENPVIGFYEPGLILEFVLGIVIGYLLDNKAIAARSIAILIVFVAFFSVIFLDAADADIPRFFVAGLPAAGLIYGLASLDEHRLWPHLPWLVSVGDATYSIYLTHIFVLAGLRMLTEMSGLSLDTWLLKSAFVGAALACSIALGLFVFHFVEKPIGRALRRSRPPSHTRHDPSCALTTGLRSKPSCR